MLQTGDSIVLHDSALYLRANYLTCKLTTCLRHCVGDWQFIAMKRIVVALLLLSGICCHATLTLVKREPFIGQGTLTSTSPGTNFSSVTGTLTLVRVGPRTSSIAAPGWSADIRTGASTSRGTINLSGPASLCGMWGAWVRVKTLPPIGTGYMSVLQLIDESSNVVMDFSLNSNGVISTRPYDSGGTGPTFTSPAITPNTWVWLAVAWQIQSGSNFPYGIRCMSMPLGGKLTTWGSADGLNALATSFTAVNVGLQTGGNGPMLRIGCPSLYSMASFADIAYPSDIIAPVEQSNNWYVNTSSGNDNNDGATAATAWKTADKITLESKYCGMLDSNAAGPGGGDVLTIDTSGGPLVIDTNTLAFATQGLKVQPVSGQTYIKCQAEEFLANSAFTATAGLTETYQTTDTQANIVAWQNDEWMWHVKSASYGTSAAITNPKTGVTTNYASTGAALDAVAGSFYTNGTTLYIHPFGNTNPKTDGNTYTRSINRSGGLAAVAFTAGNYRALDFYVRKTALVDSGDNDFGAYCFQGGVLSGTGMSSSVEGGYFAYGDKHCFGSTEGVTNSTLLVLNTECEQGQPYCGYGGQTPFVSYTGTTTADNVHTYRGCTCLNRSGLIGSTTGDPVGTGGDIILSHNDGTGISFASITLDDCNFTSGSATMGVANNLIITDHTQIGEVNTSCTNTNIQETTFPFQLVQMRTGASSLTLQNCLIKPVFALSPAPGYYGLLLMGNVTIEGCTFDLSGITGNSNSYFAQGIIERVGALNLTFRNNAYVVPSGENLPLLYDATNSDTFTFDHNAYDLGAGTILARAYTNSSSSDLTFAQWQALGKDCSNSSLNANLLLQGDVPPSGSPLLNGGIDLGSMADYTGTTYAHRDTIGAYQGNAAYVAPQSITGFPPLAALTLSGTPATLPATTAAGLKIVYMVVSGPAKLSGNSLTLTGTGTVTLTATQAGNSSYAPLTETETITVLPPEIADTPTLPEWGLAVLALLLVATAGRSLISSNARR
jgi:hypothetical protein